MSRTLGVTTWNGGVCPHCGTRFLGSHVCSPEDIIRRINELLALLSKPAMRPVDQRSLCPWRPENGGSGVCGCILGGPEVTC